MTWKTLKNNQSRDPNDMINELFKPGTIGNDLKVSLLSLVNGIKRTMEFPTFTQLSNITTNWKRKGSRLSMNNDRGIFILTVT